MKAYFIAGTVLRPQLLVPCAILSVADRMTQWANLKLLLNKSRVGVWHISDIPLAFNTYADLTIGSVTGSINEKLLSARLKGAWPMFALPS